MFAYFSDLLLDVGPHPYLVGVATLWVFSAAVGAMNAPTQESRRGYQWVYRFAHLLAANLDRAGLMNTMQNSMSDTSTSK